MSNSVDDENTDRPVDTAFERWMDRWLEWNDRVMERMLRKEAKEFYEEHEGKR